MVRDRRRQMGAAVRGQAVGAVLERARQRQVHVRPLARQQVVDHDLAQERVAEHVAALLVGDDELGGDGLAQGVAQRARVDAGGGGEDLVVEPAARREHAQRLLRVGERRSIRSISASRSVGGSEPRPSVPAASSSSANSGLPSLRANSRLSRSSPGISPRMSLSCSAELLARERAQLDAAVARVALELGQQRAQRVAAVQLVRAVGRDDEHALLAEAARQVDEERAGRAVGPVQVLDRDHQPVLAREQLQQLEQAVEQARLGGRLVVVAGLAEAGEDLGERAARGVGELLEGRVAGAGQRAQRADDRRVGQLALAQLDAVAADHADAVGAGRALELGQQAGLPHARLAGHERERRTAADGLGQRPAQLDELCGASDEGRARNA